MAQILIILGYTLTILGFFVPLFFDELKKMTNFWLVVIGFGLLSMVTSIVIFSGMFNPPAKPEEQNTPASEPVSGVFFYQNINARLDAFLIKLGDSNPI